jgi:hypothetical protein
MYRIVPKNLVGPSDLSSEEVPEESGHLQYIRLIVVSNTVLTDMYYNRRLTFGRIESESSIRQIACELESMQSRDATIDLGHARHEFCVCQK